MTSLHTEPLWLIPFVVLLGCIAVLPVAAKHFWERNYMLISIGLGLVVLLRYALWLDGSQVLAKAGTDYVSFICLIGSLFVVSGGIHINVKGEATPLVNSAFLLVGALLANLFGTTGASMVLIRPWLRMNKYRLTAYHVVFFIFLVSNVGGALTPIGDPPLFLGFLEGVKFGWVFLNLWPMWLLATGLVISIFFVIDSVNFRKAPPEVREKETAQEKWKFRGMHNILFLSMIICAVLLHKFLPEHFPGLPESSISFLSAGIMFLVAVWSYRTSRSVHGLNHFSFVPIKEVAVLFAGIFATMIPALELIEKQPIPNNPELFYWGSGALSSVLDNAPTYLCFLTAAISGLGMEPGTPAAEEMIKALLDAKNPQLTQLILAISVGSVFFGAMTYVGNGPNLLVKSIADGTNAKTPSFFGYIFKYSLPVLLPIYTLIWFLFFRA